MLTNSKIVLSLALALATTSAAMAAPKHAVRHHTAMAAPKQAVRHPTAIEQRAPTGAYRSFGSLRSTGLANQPTRFPEPIYFGLATGSDP